MKKYLLTFLFMINFIIGQEYLRMEEIDFSKEAKFYTVLNGEKVEGFDIDLIDIVTDPELGKMILFKNTSSQIILNGGVAEGMSGSPVYQSGKVIGAVAFGLKENSNYGLIMPMDFLEENNYTYTLKGKSGKSVVVDPFRGDIGLEMIGTVSFDNEKDMIIYGHKLENKGNIAYFLYDSKVSKVVPTMNLAFKIAKKNENIGYIYKDYKYGLAGKYTKEIPVESYNFNLSNGENLKFDLVKNRNTRETYLEKGIEMILNKAFDHDGYRSAKYSLEIYDDEKTLLKENDILVSNDNIKISLANTLYNQILTASHSRFGILDYKGINFNITLLEEEELIHVLGVDILGNVFLLGDKLKITFDTYIHGKGEVEIVEEISIPEDFVLGSMKLELVMDNSQEEKKSRSLTEHLENLQEKTKNNEILVLFKNQYDTVVYQTKIVWDYYILSDKNFIKNIVIDSFEASS